MYTIIHAVVGYFVLDRASPEPAARRANDTYGICADLFDGRCHYFIDRWR